MFINKTSDKRNNLCGVKVAEVRKGMKISQRQLSDLLNEAGLTIDKNAVQRIESGQRFVIDTELPIIAKVLGITINELLSL